MFRTSNQAFDVHFTGAPPDIKHWGSFLRSHSSALATAFLYVFNRRRAASAIEQKFASERSYIDELIRDFRGIQGPEQALKQIVGRTHFDWAVASIYGTHTGMLVPIAVSDASLLRDLRPLAANSLERLSGIFNADKMQLLNIGSHNVNDCNCSLFTAMGATEVAFLRFGSGPAATALPRGILSLYRKLPRRPTEEDELYLRLSARELAAWVDEVDERIEGAIVQASIKSAADECKVAAEAIVNETVFDTVLKSLAKACDQGIQTGRPDERVGPPFVCGFSSDHRSFGITPSTAQRNYLPTPFTDIETSCFSSASRQWLAARSAKNRRDIFFFGCSEKNLTLLRPHVFELLFLLVELVYHIVGVERRRTSWMQRTIHEVRQPLQGLIGMADEISRLSQTTVPRRTIANYADDMVTGILKLKVLLHIFNNVAKLESIMPALRPTFIDADVLRPIRRMLIGVARKKRLVILEPNNLAVIPQIQTDPDLLSIVFYNLLDNAIKYGKANSEIEIECDDIGHYYAIAVRNEGPEVFEHEVALIFSEGYRGESVRENEVGLGLGLNMARKIATSLDCKVDLTERGDRGYVCFRLLIPKELRA